MAKSKKEFNKEAMYKKIMPSMFKINDESNNAEDTDEVNKNDIENSSLSKLFEEVKNIKSDDIIEENNFKDIKDNEAPIREQEANEIISQEEAISTDVDNLEMNLSSSENKYTINFIEVLIKDKLDAVLDRFKCCRCEECLNDIVEISLNSLPKYSFTGTKKEIEDAFNEFKQTNNIDVISAIIKAIIIIRKKENHNKN